MHSEAVSGAAAYQSTANSLSHAQEVGTINLCGEKLIDNTMIGREGVSAQII